MEPTAQETATTADPKPQLTRIQLFAAAGERIYLIEKMQGELNLIRVELDKERPTYPPSTEAPKPETTEAAPNG